MNSKVNSSPSPLTPGLEEHQPVHGTLPRPPGTPLLLAPHLQRKPPWTIATQSPSSITVSLWRGDHHFLGSSVKSGPLGILAQLLPVTPQGSAMGEAPSRRPSSLDLALDLSTPPLPQSLRTCHGQAPHGWCMGWGTRAWTPDTCEWDLVWK